MRPLPRSAVHRRLCAGCLDTAARCIHESAGVQGTSGCNCASLILCRFASNSLWQSCLDWHAQLSRGSSTEITSHYLKWLWSTANAYLSVAAHGHQCHFCSTAHLINSALSIAVPDSIYWDEIRGIWKRTKHVPCQSHLPTPPQVAAQSGQKLYAAINPLLLAGKCSNILLCMDSWRASSFRSVQTDNSNAAIRFVSPFLCDLFQYIEHCCLFVRSCSLMKLRQSYWS